MLRLPRPEARKLWQQELALVGKMLSLDSRNFHGWGYRREVVAALESLADDGEDEHTMTSTELDYTTKMIGTNLSNFSAWHNRSQLILKLLHARSASDTERKKTLDDGELLLNILSCIKPDIKKNVWSASNFSESQSSNSYIEP